MIIKGQSLQKLIAVLLFVTMVFVSLPVQIVAAENNNIGNIVRLVNLAEEEKGKYGEATDETVNKLKTELNRIGVETGAYSNTQYIEYYGENAADINGGIWIRGYGETHKIDKIWSYRVDRPSARDAKPHVHVSKNGKEVGAENVDGTSSHGKNLNKVPKKVREKVRNSKDYKKGKSDLKKMQKAKYEIKRRGLNLRNAKDLIIAAGIFVAIVGVAFFAPEALPGALALI